MQTFVSYQRIDTAFAAHAIGYALREAGGEVFVDTGDISGGEDFARKIADSIGQSDVLLALMGKRFDAGSLKEPESVVASEWRRARFHGAAVIPVLVDGVDMPELPVELRWVARNDAYSLRRGTLSADIDVLVADVLQHPEATQRPARVLWVDDHPANNEDDRRLLRPDGIRFDNVVSTAEALDQLQYENYDLIITDLGRRDSSDESDTAGRDFLRHPAVRNTTVVVYTSFRALPQKQTLLDDGAVAVTAKRATLLETVRKQLCRTVEHNSHLSPR